MSEIPLQPLERALIENFRPYAPIGEREYRGAIDLAAQIDDLEPAQEAAEGLRRLLQADASEEDQEILEAKSIRTIFSFLVGSREQQQRLTGDFPFFQRKIGPYNGALITYSVQGEQTADGPDLWWEEIELSGSDPTLYTPYLMLNIPKEKEEPIEIGEVFLAGYFEERDLADEAEFRTAELRQSLEARQSVEDIATALFRFLH